MEWKTDSVEKEFVQSALYEDVLFFQVKDLVKRIKSLLEGNFPAIWVEGEVSHLRHSQSGNVYFNLIDEDAVLKAIVFSTNKYQVTPYLREGIRVLCFGRLNFYPRSGECFFIVRRMEAVGRGLLALKKEALIKKYKEFFDPNRKKEIPRFPKKIAIITSLFGAALKDFLKVVENRWSLEVLIYPVRVQGEGAENEIVEAIKDINTKFNFVDLILITRGGGSTEDLAPFYTEEILLGIKDSKIPVVSAVGHEIDYTICDLIADKRCPTPSAAAREIVPDKDEWIKHLEIYRKKYERQIEAYFRNFEARLYYLKLQLQERSPFSKLEKIETKLSRYFQEIPFRMETLILEKERRLKDVKERFFKEFERFFEKKAEILSKLRSLLNSNSPLRILQKGYSIVKSCKSGKILKRAGEAEEGELLEVILSQGRLVVEVKEIKDE
ncbi:MAG: exodeoxyribonuclease VII large subunit [Thermodesulfobacteria bacterium]|nr:exodeoxyribonuclease VII large subunit [Thermodesulfobacteriota bacterium]